MAIIKWHKNTVLSLERSSRAHHPHVISISAPKSSGVQSVHRSPYCHTFVSYFQALSDVCHSIFGLLRNLTVFLMFTLYLSRDGANFFGWRNYAVSNGLCPSYTALFSAHLVSLHSLHVIPSFVSGGDFRLPAPEMPPSLCWKEEFSVSSHSCCETKISTPASRADAATRGLPDKPCGQERTQRENLLQCTGLFQVHHYHHQLHTRTHART